MVVSFTWLSVSRVPTIWKNLWKLESCIYFLWFHFPSQEKKKKTMNINSKRKKNPGKEIKHLLFFIVGKVAILSTFFDWRKSMYSEVWTLKKLYSKFWSWLAGIFRHSKYQDVSAGTRKEKKKKKKASWKIYQIEHTTFVAAKFSV